MELDITMRYVMVQAQRKAAGGPVYVEHVFMAMLELFDKKVTDIARRPEHERDVAEGLESVADFIAHTELDLWPTLYLLNEALAGNLQGELPAPDDDVPGWLARQVDSADETQNYAFSYFLFNFDDTRTPLIDLCWVKGGFVPTPKAGAAQKGQEVIAGRLGQASGTSAADAATVFSDNFVNSGTDLASQETIPAPKPPKPEPIPPKPVPEPPKPVPEPPKPVPEPPKPRPEPPKAPEPPARPLPDVVYIPIPPPQPVPPPNPNPIPGPRPGGRGSNGPKPPARKTRIAGLTFKGGPFMAAVKYYLLVLVIPVVLCIIFRERLGRLVPSEPWTMAVTCTLGLLWAALILRGIFALLGRRCKALEFFANSMINVVWVPLAILAITKAGGYEQTPLFVKIIIVLWAFILMGLCLAILRHLTDFLIKENRKRNLFARTGVGKVSGTPSTIFFEYLLRACMFVFLVFSVVWLGNLQVNGFWRAAFAIYGFLLAFEVIRIMLLCWSLDRAITPPNNYYPLSQFLLTEYSLLSLPAFGLFLMWYFNWLPMPTWVIVLYCIYGALWLLIGIVFLLTPKDAMKRG